MIIKKLTDEIQSLLNASTKINNYKDAIEELVYNSLDANATSVAIRIHIYENFIQVIDNGIGIAKYDISLLGQRYASSKVTDESSLKTAPINFGFRGESLSNIIEVSQCVKITTRHRITDETWTKSFYKGQHKDSQITSMRPSKGTTVEIKGFLYNLHIQKKSINPLNEMQNIKLFLKQLSLVNTNVSISFRDNSRNEIIFKVHKNRDVYQTLSSLYEIDKNNLQELQIEKHQYKARGFIGNGELTSYRWIYLNGRFLHKCALYDIINANFTKNRQQGRIVKNKNNFHDFEKKIQNNQNEIPTYFIFITCPHFDYDINITSTKTIIEFKDWSQIKQLLEKLIQFYKGDITLKKIDVDQTDRKNRIEETREEVRKIIEKVLGNKNKGHKILQLQKSVKGKIVKKKKDTKSSSIQRLKNMYRTRKEHTKTDHNLRVSKENPSSDIKEVPVSMDFEGSRKGTNKMDHQIKNNYNLKKKPKSKKEKRKNKSKLNIEPLIQQNEIVKNHINNKEIVEIAHNTMVVDTSPLVIQKTPTCNNLQVACNVKTAKSIVKKQHLKSKPLMSKNEKQKIKRKQYIDPIIKQYLKENAIRCYCPNLKEVIKQQINESKENNLHNYDIEADKAFFGNQNNNNLLYIHKNLSFTVNNVTPLNRVEREYLKSSDLLKTILNTQKSYSCINEKNNLQFQKPFHREHCYYGKSSVHLQKEKPSERGNDYCVVNNINHGQNINNSFENGYSYFIGKNTNHFKNVQEFSNKKNTQIRKDMVHLPNRDKLTSNYDHYLRPNERTTHVNNIESNISTTHIYNKYPKLTFESHKYDVDNLMIMKNKKLKRFISERSKENFSLHNNIKHTFNVTTNKYQSYLNLKSNTRNKRKNLHQHPYIKPVENPPYYEHKSSHIFEFSTTYNNVNKSKQNTTLNQMKYKIRGNVQNTYTILDSNGLDIESYLKNTNKSTINDQDSVASYLRFNLSSPNNLTDKKSQQKPTVRQNIHENIMEVNISNTAMPVIQETNNFIEPLNICEAVYHTKNDHIMSRYFTTVENSQHLTLNNNQNLTNAEQYCGDKDTRNQLEEIHSNDILDNIPLVVANGDPLSHLFNKKIEKSLHFQTIESNHELQLNKSKNINTEEEHSIVKETSNTDSKLLPNNTRISNQGVEIIEHFQTSKNNEFLHIDNVNNSGNNEQHRKDETRKLINDIKNKHNEFEIVQDCSEMIENVNNYQNQKASKNFKLRNRHSFLPKGMSPIFENCNNKNICSYNLETDYFHDDMYNNFANDVMDNIKIFENKVANVNDASEKMNRDQNSLKFDAKSLENAKVFGQVDRKFLVAELQSDNLNTKHLVLFDQHAVHERINLEENISDYKYGDQWNSINCETLSLTLSKDTVLYLNNFRDKFKQFGLEWEIKNDCLITVNAIPKAIFGKHCRQAVVIIQSIKNLILEEIKAIKCLGGNTLLYPKSIMDLVFSEACRHAIKFGDKLSKRECATLIRTLACCKTPFQCAHGRPVLAVLSDLKTYVNEYKLDASKILSFRNKLI